MNTPADSAARTPLSRARVLTAAVALADGGGIADVTMRKIARTLGVEAMSLYRYVAGKDDLLDGMVDAVFAEIDLPDQRGGWKAEMRRRAHSARAALNRHPWAVALMDSRANPGAATLRHHDSVVRCLRAGGFSVELTAHAFSVLDSYVHGFALQEAALPFRGEAELAGVADAVMGRVDIASYPHFVELATEHLLKPAYSYGAEFEFGLELILQGLEAAAG